MALPDIKWVPGPDKLIGRQQPHIVLHHQVLNDTGRSQRVAIPTVDQNPLPFLQRGFDALIDVPEARLLQRSAFLLRVPLDMHLETGPAMLGPSAAGTGDETEAAVPGQTAHVDDAVNVVLAQYLSAVSCTEVSHVDAVHYPGDDWF